MRLREERLIIAFGLENFQEDVAGASKLIEQTLVEIRISALIEVGLYVGDA